MFTALPALAVLAVLGAVLAIEHRNSSADDRLRETSELAMAAAANARGYLDDRFSTLAVVAASPTVRMRAPGLRRYLEDAAGGAGFASLAFVDRRGRSRISTAVPPGAPPVDVADREYFTEAIAGRPNISDALRSRFSGRPVVVFSYPVTGAGGHRSGVLASSLRLDSVGAGLRRLLFLEGPSTTIIDGAGNVIAGPEFAEGLQPAPAGYPLERMREQEAGTIVDDGRVLGFATVPRAGWLAVVDRARSDVLGPLDRALIAEIAALALLALVGVLLTFATARRLDRLDRERDEALAQQQEIAVQLQHSLLPEIIAPEGLRTQAGYVPAQGAMSVGGDWYDLLDAGDGQVALSVGDVVGHGLIAATTMGKLRSATRSIALQRSTPAAALEHLDRFASLLDGHPLATVVYAVMDLNTGELRYASAGHPPPLIRRRDGSTEFLEGGRSPLLGIGRRIRPHVEDTVALAPGDTLVLYTDGLVERPDLAIDTGLAELAERVRADGDDPVRLARDLLASVREPRRDDAAVLVVRLDAVRQPSSVAS
jgi:serine phosphatase RsbU (regulator of sigma subunit)